MQNLSAIWPYIIEGFFAVFLVLWAGLWWHARRMQRTLLDYLNSVARDLPRRNDLGAAAAREERIDALIADFRDFIQTPGNEAGVRALYDRIGVKDESRPYKRLHRFEVGYSIARGSIEIFPLLGILGTVIAISAGMSASGTSDPDKVNRVVQNFGESVRSTGWGIGAAVLFLFMNACLETSFEKLLAYGQTVGEIVTALKVRLGIEGAKTAVAANASTVTPVGAAAGGGA